MFVCLLMLVAVAVCLDMPPNMKALEPPKDGAKPNGSRYDPQIPSSRPDGPPLRTDGKPDLPKVETPKPDAKPPQDGRS